jgi:predicted porin
MKKSLLAVAVLGVFSGAIYAQSSVRMFGTVDVQGRYVKADGQSRRLSQANSGLNSSQLVFSGLEDLGGGLKAGFTLSSDLDPDTGNANRGGKFFNRRSTVSLLGGFGEIRLGRDYTPTFWNQTLFDAFGTLGLGSSINPRQMYSGTRSDNAIGYFLPANLGGFYGQAMVAAAEGGTTLDRPSRYVGARFGFAAGPFDVAVGAATQRLAAPFAANSAAAGALAAGAVTGLPGDSWKTFNVGGSWDFGFFKVLGYWDRETLRNARENFGSVSGIMPFGQNEIHLGYDRSKYTNGGTTSSVDQIKASYVYNLSKRTAMYATASRLDNKSNTRYTLPGANGLTTANGDSQGAEFGIRHFF